MAGFPSFDFFVIFNLSLFVVAKNTRANEPEEVVVTTTPDKIDKEAGKLTPEEDARITEVFIVKVEGVTAAAVSKKKETTIEKKEKITPAQPQEPTRGYEEQKVHTVFQIVVPEERKEAVIVTFEVTLKDGEDSSKLSSFYLKHYNGNGWDAGHIAQSAQPKAVEGKENTWALTFRMTEFSPFALVSETALPKSSSGSSSSGYSTWATPAPTTAQTPVATPGAVETPSVQQPIVQPPAGEQSDSSAKTPAPFLGILAGLGAAAAVFGLRRK